MQPKCFWLNKKYIPNQKYQQLKVLCFLLLSDIMHNIIFIILHVIFSYIFYIMIKYNIYCSESINSVILAQKHIQTLC